MNSLKQMDAAKRKIMFMLKSFDIFYNKRTAKTVHESVSNAGNPLIKILYDIMSRAVDSISPYLYHGAGGKLSEKKRDRYKDRIRNPVEFFLNIPYIDSAYLDPFLWAAHEFGKKCREDAKFWDYLEKNVKPPEHWYFNVWENFKGETYEKQESGEITKDEKANSEYLMVDNANIAGLHEFTNRRNKEYKKHNHW